MNNKGFIKFHWLDSFKYIFKLLTYLELQNFSFDFL